MGVGVMLYIQVAVEKKSSPPSPVMMMNHVIHISKLYHLYRRVMSQLWTSHNSKHTYGWVMSQIWRSHESNHTYGRVMSQIWTSDFMSQIRTWRVHTTCDGTSSYLWHVHICDMTWLVHICDMTRPYVWYDWYTTYLWYIMSQIRTSPVTSRMNTSCSYLWHDSSICMVWLIYHISVVYHVTNTN